MKNLKNNFIEIGKDSKALVVSTVSLTVDIVKLPISLCKDVRDKYLDLKSNKAKKANKQEISVDLNKESNKEVSIEIKNPIKTEENMAKVN